MVLLLDVVFWFRRDILDIYKMCWLVVAAAGVVGETLVLLSPSLSLFLFLSLHFGNSLLLGATTTVPT